MKWYLDEIYEVIKRFICQHYLKNTFVDLQINLF